MDLYEALKSGTSPDELIKTFNKDLEEARAKVERDERLARLKKELEEKKAKMQQAEEEKKEKALTARRDSLATALKDYVETVFPDVEADEQLSVEEIADMFKAVEEEMNNLLGFTKYLKKLNKLDSRYDLDSNMFKTLECSSPCDDDIIKRFLKSL